MAGGRSGEAPAPEGSLDILYPFPHSVFPPDFVPPTISWVDSTEGVAFWILELRAEGRAPLYLHTASPPLPPPVIDSQAMVPGVPVEIPDPNRHRNFVPSPEAWARMKALSLGRPATLSITGFAGPGPAGPDLGVSRGVTVFMTSPDSVKHPIFYRDVPIMPTRNATGRIQPLSKQAERLIRWSLRDVSKGQPKTVIPTLPTCANCHSFSRDGSTLGLDLDGPQSDKGSYGLARVRREMDIGRKDLFSWNYGFKDKPRGRKTIGFLSQVSPDGRYVATTVNEDVYINNFLDPKYIQVFFPTRGVLAWYEKASGAIRTLPGADSAAYVHCDPTWSPDGKWLVFARAAAKDPYEPGQEDPKYPNDPNETQIRYDLWRIPFNGGKGGRAEPIAGAGANGMSNNFPKITPDGRHVVFVKCRNGQLLRPDAMLWIVPFAGGEARKMACNLKEMNSWHSFSPDGRWMVFSSKGQSHFTRMYLTHLDSLGRDSAPVLIENATAANRAVNLPEFANFGYDDLDKVTVSGVDHMRHMQDAYSLLEARKPEEAKAKMLRALAEETIDRKFRSEVQVLLAWMVGTPDSGVALIRGALRDDPENPLAHFNLGVLLDKQGKLRAAMAAFVKSIDLDSSNAWARAHLARIHMHAEDPSLLDTDKAVAYAKEANRVSKYREPSLIKTLARAYSEAGRFAEAAETARLGLNLARQQGLLQEARELEAEAVLYEGGRSFSWGLKNAGGPP